MGLRVVCALGVRVPDHGRFANLASAILYFYPVLSYVMFVRVAQLFEDGRPLPRHRSITARPVHTGYLTLTDQHDRDFRRGMTYAVLRDAVAGGDVLPRLRDAVVRWIGDGCMTISGFEFDDTSRECTVQSWYVQLVNDDADN